MVTHSLHFSPPRHVRSGTQGLSLRPPLPRVASRPLIRAVPCIVLPTGPEHSTKLGSLLSPLTQVNSLTEIEFFGSHQYFGELTATDVLREYGRNQPHPHAIRPEIKSSENVYNVISDLWRSLVHSDTSMPPALRSGFPPNTALAPPPPPHLHHVGRWPQWLLFIITILVK